MTPFFRSLRCRCGTACSVVAYGLTMLAVAWFVLRGAESMGYNWQWYRIPRFILLPDGSPGPLLHGAGITLLTVNSVALKLGNTFAVNGRTPAQGERLGFIGLNQNLKTLRIRLPKVQARGAVIKGDLK